MNGESRARHDFTRASVPVVARGHVIYQNHAVYLGLEVSWQPSQGRLGLVRA